MNNQIYLKQKLKNRTPSRKFKRENTSSKLHE